MIAELAQQIMLVGRRHAAPPDPIETVLRDPLLWAPIGILLGTFLFYRGFRLLQRKRFIVNTPACTIRAAALGRVEINGRADGPYTLVAPVSKRDCLYFQVKALQVGDSNRGAKKIIADACAPFFVSDATGNVMIDPRGAELQLPSTSRDGTSTNSYLSHFLAQHGADPSATAGVDEYCVEIGDQLFITGTLQENPQPRGLPRSPFERGPRGYLTEAEADIQRREAFESLDPLVPLGSGGSDREFDMNPPVILAKGEGPFLISQQSEREILADLGARSFLYIWGGPLLALLCLWRLLLRLGP